MMWQHVSPFLALIVSAFGLRAAFQPGAYRGLSLRESVWILVHVDHHGLAALMAFVLVDTNYFISLR